MKKLLWTIAIFLTVMALVVAIFGVYLMIHADGWKDVVLGLALIIFVAGDMIKDLYLLPPWRHQQFCRHPDWRYVPEENAMYACGEDGAFAWRCVNCEKRIYTDELIKPGAQV